MCLGWWSSNSFSGDSWLRSFLRVDFFIHLSYELYLGSYLLGSPSCHPLSFIIFPSALGIYPHCFLKRNHILCPRPSFQIFRQGIFKHELKYISEQRNFLPLFCLSISVGFNVIVNVMRLIHFQTANVFFCLCFSVALINCLTNQIHPKQKPDATRPLESHGQEMPQRKFQEWKCLFVTFCYFFLWNKH